MPLFRIIRTHKEVLDVWAEDRDEAEEKAQSETQLWLPMDWEEPLVMWALYEPGLDQQQQPDQQQHDEDEDEEPCFTTCAICQRLNIPIVDMMAPELCTECEARLNSRGPHYREIQSC
jgi:hypothetical protein